MKIFLGTKSEDKLAILESIIKDLYVGRVDVVTCDVASGVSDQPLDEETTITGATNRARAAYESGVGNIGLDLEGGLVMSGGVYHLVCVAAVVKDGDVYIGKSGIGILPKNVSDAVMEGGEFGILIRAYYAQGQLGSQEEQEHVHGLITRKQYFIEAIKDAFLKTTES